MTQLPDSSAKPLDGIMNKETRSYSDEVLLRPHYLAPNKRAAMSNVFKVPTNRIAPINIPVFPKNSETN